VYKAQLRIRIVVVVGIGKTASAIGVAVIAPEPVGGVAPIHLHEHAVVLVPVIVNLSRGFIAVEKIAERLRLAAPDGDSGVLKGCRSIHDTLRYR
jgi:hypothetical protein